MRIQSFIDLRKRQRNGVLPIEIEEKRKVVVHDWWYLIIWYVRLRKAARGVTPKKLLYVEERIQR